MQRNGGTTGQSLTARSLACLCNSSPTLLIKKRRRNSGLLFSSGRGLGDPYSKLLPPFFRAVACFPTPSLLSADGYGIWARLARMTGYAVQLHKLQHVRTGKAQDEGIGPIPCARKRRGIGSDACESLWLFQHAAASSRPCVCLFVCAPGPWTLGFA